MKLWQRRFWRRMPNKKNKALGRGLEALFSTFEEDAQAEETVVELKIDEIRSNPYQPRKIFDEAGLAELAESIKQQGVFSTGHRTFLKCDGLRIDCRRKEDIELPS